MEVCLLGRKNILWNVFIIAWFYVISFYCKIWETFILLRDRQDYNSDIHTCDKLVIKGDNLKWNFIEWFIAQLELVNMLSYNLMIVFDKLCGWNVVMNFTRHDDDDELFTCNEFYATWNLMYVNLFCSRRVVVLPLRLP